MNVVIVFVITVKNYWDYENSTVAPLKVNYRNEIEVQVNTHRNYKTLSNHHKGYYYNFINTPLEDLLKFYILIYTSDFNAFLIKIIE